MDENKDLISPFDAQFQQRATFRSLSASVFTAPSFQAVAAVTDDLIPHQRARPKWEIAQRAVVRLSGPGRNLLQLVDFVRVVK